MKEIKLATTIDCSAKEAFDFAINPANTQKWVNDIVLEEANEAPTKLGTIYRNKDREGNWREFEITAYEPGVMFELTKKDDNHRVRYTVKPLSDNQCELEYYVWADDGELRGAFTQKNIETILKNLKSVVENEE